MPMRTNLPHTPAMTTRTIRLLLAYDGTGFRGWAAQRDPRVRTVEGVLTPVVEAVAGGAGRAAG